MSERKIVFLVRKKPESIGGVQRHNARLLAGLSGNFDIDKIVWRGPEWGVPFAFPYFYLRSAGNGARLIHCDDAVTGLMGAKIRALSGKKTVATVHGLDVILPLPWYQNRLKANLKTLDVIICVSRATAREVEARGVPSDKIEIIPNSAEKVDSSLPEKKDIAGELKKITGIDIENKIVLFSLGRPLRRKGFDTFIENVFRYLPENYIYIVAGPVQKTPPWIKTVAPLIDKETLNLLLIASGCDSVHEKLKKLGDHPRVYYLNSVTEDTREMLFAASDLFIMPNRKIRGDMEGFGIVALEAAVRGIPVVATGIEGITDAVIDGENGFCVEEGDYKQMTDTIIKLTSDIRALKEFGLKAREFTERKFSPEAIYGRYAEIFGELVGPANQPPSW